MHVPNDTRFALLDPLRGVAALWVLTFHFSWDPWLHEGSPSIAALFRVGHLGVALFFVISGYCIVGAARHALATEASAAAFMYRRFRRVYPTYWFAVLLAILMPFWLQAVSALKTGVYIPPPDTLNNGFLHYSAADWLSVVTLTRVFVDVPGAASLQAKFTSLNAVYWTLAIEVQFYVVVGLAMTFRRWFYPALVLVTLAGIGAMFVPSLALAGIFLPYWPMFAIGGLLYWLVERRLCLPTPTTRVGLGVLAVTSVTVALAGGAVLTRVAPSPWIVALAFGLWLWLVFPVDAVVARWRRADVGLVGRVVRSPIFALGSMSYSLYLVHPKLLLIAAQPISQVLRMHPAMGDLLTVVTTCLGAFVFYWLAERRYATAPRRREVAPSPATEPVSVPA